jgi:hypothetical protein
MEKSKCKIQNANAKCKLKLDQDKSGAKGRERGIQNSKCRMLIKKDAI